jgi:hypothetical protein
MDFSTRIGLQVQIGVVNLGKNLGIISEKDANTRIDALLNKEANKYGPTSDQIKTNRPTEETGLKATAVLGKATGAPPALQSNTLNSIGYVISRVLSDFFGSSPVAIAEKQVKIAQREVKLANENGKVEDKEVAKAKLEVASANLMVALANREGTPEHQEDAIVKREVALANRELTLVNGEVDQKGISSKDTKELSRDEKALISSQKFRLKDPDDIKAHAKLLKDLSSSTHPNITTDDSTLTPENKQTLVNGLKETIQNSTFKMGSSKFTSVRTIDYQRIAHKDAKNFLSENLPLTGITKLDFISPPKNTKSIELQDVTIDENNPLDSSIFSFHVTGKLNEEGKPEKHTGVRTDILNDGKRTEDNVVVYGVASQFNGCEAPSERTLPPNEILTTYERDNTQGPQAQLAFADEQVELIGCAGNLGFNGLANVLDEETKGQIGHGYLTPQTEEMGKKVIDQLKANSNKIEYMSVANVPKGAEGGKPVHQILVAAPAFGDYGINSTASVEQKQEIQFLCALQGYRAQFAQCIQLAKDEGKPVTFKPTAVGLGAFGNDPKIVAKAFYAAGKEFQNDLKNNNVTVELQVFIIDEKNDRGAKQMANDLGLKKNPRDEV